MARRLPNLPGAQRPMNATERESVRAFGDRVRAREAARDAEIAAMLRGQEIAKGNGNADATPLSTAELDPRASDRACAGVPNGGA